MSESEDAEPVGDCYTTAEDAPLPIDTNRYAIALLAGTANAGDLDRYMHCRYLPVIKPPQEET